MNRFSALALATEARNTHGLRFQDYEKYREWCSRNVYRLRKALKIVQKGRKYSELKVTAEQAKDQRYLEILLFNAERAWAQASEIKAVSEQDENNVRHQHCVRRLAKAAQYARDLAAILASPEIGADAATQLDAIAYAASFAGQWYFEKRAWEQCLEQVSVARVAWNLLDAGVENDLFKDAATGTDPSIRYCAYQTSQGQDRDISSLTREYVRKDARVVEVLKKLNPSALDKQTEELSAVIEQVSWRGYVAPVSDPAIAVSLLRVQDIQNASEVSEALATRSFDDVLAAWADASDATQKAISEEEHGAQDQEKLQALQITYTYVNYSEITTRIRRDLLLAAALLSRIDDRRPPTTTSVYRDLIKLYDSILQSLTSIFDLPGVAADQDFCAELEAKLSYFKAQRASFLARSWAVQDEYKNALALFLRALAYARRASGPLSVSVEADYVSVTAADVNNLVSKLVSEVSRTRALLTMNLLTAPTEATEPNALIYALNEYPDLSVPLDLGRLVELPPKFQAVPVKPVFFDIAYNYIGYETAQGLEDEPLAAQHKDEGVPTKKGGLLSRLWG
ncbi:signal recognition particle subunit srp68 [Saitoella coloradoensis]